MGISLLVNPNGRVVGAGQQVGVNAGNAGRRGTEVPERGPRKPTQVRARSGVKRVTVATVGTDDGNEAPVRCHAVVRAEGHKLPGLTVHSRVSRRRCGRCRVVEVVEARLVIQTCSQVVKHRQGRCSGRHPHLSR
jgi:hypothetical protein